jgi:hypothetical protein
MFKRLPSYCLVLAVMAAGMIPAGWMPGTDSDGKVLLVICTADGVQEQWVDLDGSPPDMPEDMAASACPFSGLNPDADLPAFALARVIEPAQAARWARAGFTHRSAGFHWRYDARGPPALS